MQFPQSGELRFEVALHLSLSADVTVTGKRTFANLADAPNPAEPRRHRAVGQPGRDHGAAARRAADDALGEVLETVPGVVISQHSGEGKANQYYLRGFNLDHGTRLRDNGRRHAGEHADART